MLDRELDDGGAPTDERGKAVAYMICEPATHYYRVMTRSDRMPVLVEEAI